MKRSLYVYIARHAESDNNAKSEDDVRWDAEGASDEPASKKAKVCLRQADPELTKRGRSQSKALARLFHRLVDDPSTQPRLKPRRIFTSCFKRSLETTRPITEALGIDAELQADTHEEGGIFEGPRRGRSADQEYPLNYGLTAEQMRAYLPRLKGTESLPSKGWWRGGVETEEEVRKRAQRCTEWLWSMLDQEELDCRHEHGAIVSVSHGLFLDRWMKALMGMDPTAPSPCFLTSNCAYWLLGLHLDPSAVEPRKVCVMCSNVVDHIPMGIRTGHSMNGSNYHMQPSYEIEVECEDKG
eukprot:gnl/TRDRNA2_/TRDRNA2_82106_c0_seq1.p1 gnl/TRDRNA2_/TRDRNA2_82106_c0~~gnl/TRDRNA2_/TRDRNA2_82106_c0_seq1.p1  ORF type:complete len:298 (-),score=41.43 gnl/TRDRNA2_/TRDRNA2_82106_c0_seq1:126-1019(-)